jgi:hypothetical protein
MTLMVVQQKCVGLYQDLKKISRKYKKNSSKFIIIHQNCTIINLSPMSQISKKSAATARGRNNNNRRIA